ncbi:MAG: ABC transporter ATP-binding protein [Spirochaetia bacterium]|nr:ABC transporter ATP-binding protein [Spirochaetia bacterium]
METSVKAEKLQKRFDKFTAVDSISFEVEKGEIYGFLGANGAGKTTTIRMLCGLLEPTSGDAIVAGYSIKKQPEEVKKRLGYMSQKFSLYPILTVEENISFYGGIYGLTDEEIKKRLPEVCEAVGLNGLEKRLAGDMPGGLKQRIALACAIAHGPEIVFLDEPTAGVDPLLRRRFWEIIDSLAFSGVTVFVTTHYMDEVENCHRIAIMHSGRIISEGTIPELKKAAFVNHLLEVETDSPVRAFELLSEAKDSIGETSVHGAMLHVVPKDPATAAAVDRMLSAAGIAHTRPEQVEPTMEDVFVRLVKREEGKI